MKERMGLKEAAFLKLPHFRQCIQCLHLWRHWLLWRNKASTFLTFFQIPRFLPASKTWRHWRLAYSFYSFKSITSFICFMPQVVGANEGIGIPSIASRPSTMKEIKTLKALQAWAFFQSLASLEFLWRDWSNWGNAQSLNSFNSFKSRHSLNNEGIQCFEGMPTPSLPWIPSQLKGWTELRDLEELKEWAFFQFLRSSLTYEDFEGFELNSPNSFKHQGIKVTEGISIPPSPSVPCFPWIPSIPSNAQEFQEAMA